MTTWKDKIQACEAKFTFEELCVFFNIIMTFTHNKNHIGTLFYNTIHIEIIVSIHISFQLLK